MGKIKLGKTATSRSRAKQKESVTHQESQILKERIKGSNTEFIDYLLFKGFSSSTIKSYSRDVICFEEWLNKENVSLETVSYADVLHYIQGKKKHVKQRTLSTAVNSLKHYFNFLSNHGVVSENPTQNISIKGIRRKKLYNILSKQELEELYHNFTFTEDEKQTKQNWYKASKLTFKRNKVILGLLIYQGLNTSELKDLTTNDLKLREGKIYIAGSRRSNERELTLEALQIMDLMEYTLKDRIELLKEFKKESNHLIISAGKGEGINNTMAMLMEKLKDLNPNIENVKQIRTSVITHWLKTHNLRQVQHMAGHRYVSSTEAYLINDLEDLLEDITKFHPIG